MTNDTKADTAEMRVLGYCKKHDIPDPPIPKGECFECRRARVLLMAADELDQLRREVEGLREHNLKSRASAERRMNERVRRSIVSDRRRR